MRRLLPRGLGDSSLISSEAIPALQESSCEVCGRPVKGKQRYYSYRRYKRDLCGSCKYKADIGELDDPKESPASPPILEEFPEADLPF